MGSRLICGKTRADPVQPRARDGNSVKKNPFFPRMFGCLGSSFRGPCVSWAVVWQTRPIAITANKEARRLLRPRFKTVFTGYLIIRLGAEVTVNQHFAFRHHCGQHSYVLRFGNLEFSQNFFARCCHCRSHIRRLPHARGIDRASSDAIRVSAPMTLAHQIKASASRPLTPRAAVSPSTRSDRHAFPTAF